MKTFIYLLLSIAWVATACRDSASPTVTNAINSSAQKHKITTDTKGADSLANMDTTHMVVDDALNITINNTLLEKKDKKVYLALYNNWLRAYTESKHLPVALSIQVQRYRNDGCKRRHYGRNSKGTGQYEKIYSTGQIQEAV